MCTWEAELDIAGQPQVECLLQNPNSVPIFGAWPIQLSVRALDDVSRL